MDHEELKELELQYLRLENEQLADLYQNSNQLHVEEILDMKNEVKELKEKVRLIFNLAKNILDTE